MAYFSGLLAEKRILKVNYTRKINHFAISFLPELLLILFTVQQSHFKIVISTAITVLYFVLFTKPVRNRYSVFKTMFAAIDRPEDRPHTLRWFMVQYILAILVMIPVYIYFSAIGKISLVYIALFINNIGDGLAEPVGVKFGRHKYLTTAIFTRKKYIRTLEGSMCVFISAIILLITGYHLFSPMQFTMALLTVPLGSTIAEAKSPHTMDAPFIIGVSGLLLGLIVHFF
jgi:phytol kinase